MKWKHNIVLLHRRGRVKAQCEGKGCGWQTPWLGSEQDACDEGRKHNGLVEKERTRAGR